MSGIILLENPGTPVEHVEVIDSLEVLIYLERERIHSQMTEHGYSRDLVDNMKIAVGEAMTNLRWAFPHRDYQVYIRGLVSDEKAVRVIEDSGIGVINERRSYGKKCIHGRGIPLMKALTLCEIIKNQPGLHIVSLTIFKNPEADIH